MLSAFHVIIIWRYLSTYSLRLPFTHVVCHSRHPYLYQHSRYILDSVFAVVHSTLVLVQI